MYSVTKGILIQFIDGKCLIKKRRNRKITLSSYYIHPSRELLLMPSGANTQAHTHTHTHIYRRVNKSNFKKPGTRGMPGLTITNLTIT